jgi:hypothetical protein
LKLSFSASLFYIPLISVSGTTFSGSPHARPYETGQRTTAPSTGMARHRRMIH